MTTSIEKMTEPVAGLRSASRPMADLRSIELITPVVLEAVPVLDVESAPNGGTVRVYFPNMRDADLVAIVWFGTPGVGTRAWATDWHRVRFLSDKSGACALN